MIPDFNFVGLFLLDQQWFISLKSTFRPMISVSVLGPNITFRFYNQLSSPLEKSRYPRYHLLLSRTSSSGLKSLFLRCIFVSGFFRWSCLTYRRRLCRMLILSDLRNGWLKSCIFWWVGADAAAMLVSNVVLSQVFQTHRYRKRRSAVGDTSTWRGELLTNRMVLINGV